MRALRIFCKSILAIFLLSLLFWTLVLGILQTKKGQTWAFDQFITYVEQQTQSHIQVGKVEFAFPLHLHLKDVSISQDNYPLIKIQDIELLCTFPKLLQGRLVFSKLQISHVDIQQFPSTLPSTDKKNSIPWETPLFPFYVKFENIDIQDVHIDRKILETFNLPLKVRPTIHHSSWNLQGMLSNNPFRGSITAHLLLSANNESTFSPFCSLGIDTQHHQLSFSFHCDSFPLQFIETNLSPTLKTHLALYASAPVNSWQYLSQNSIDDKEPIKGHFKLYLHSPAEDSNLLGTLIGQETSLRGRYLLNTLTTIELFDLKIDNPSFFLNGEVTLTSNQIIQKGKFKGKIENIERFQNWLGKETQGILAFDGKVTGSLQSPTLSLHVTSPKLLVSQLLFQDVSATFQTTPQNNQWNGFLNLAFDHQTIPWKLATSFNWHDQKLTLDPLQANALDSHLEGAVTYDTHINIWKGQVEAQTDNMNNISNFFDIAMNGEGQVTLQLVAIEDNNYLKQQGFQAILKGRSLKWMDYQARQLTLNIDIDPLQKGTDFFNVHSFLEGEQINYKDYSAAHGTAYATYQVDIAHRHLIHLSTKWNLEDIQGSMGQASQIIGQAHLQNPLQEVQGTIQLAIQKIKTPTTYIEELTGISTLGSDQTQWPFSITGKGVGKENILFTADGTWYYQKDHIEFQTNHLKGHLGLYPVQLLKPMFFMNQSNQTQLIGLHLQWGEAELQADYKQEQQHFSSQFKTNPIPSELLHYLAPELPMTGYASFQGHLEGSLQDPKGQIDIDLHNIQITEDIFAQKPSITGKIHVDLDRSGLKLKSQLNGIGQTPLALSGSLPATFCLEPFNFKIDTEHAFNLNLNAEGELDPYLHLFYNDTTNLSGQAKIALQLSGQMHAPQIQGQVDLINGVYESLSTGALYHHIEAHLEGNGSKILLTRFSAQDNKNGTITATGAVTVDTDKNFPFEFQIRPSKISILDADYASISASGSLSLIGNVKQSKLQGELTIDQALVHLEAALPQQIKTVDVRYINLPEGQQLPTYLGNKDKNSPIELDIKLQALQNVQIQGNHFKSDWKGTIAVTGTSDKPQFHGDLRIAQGQYDFNGKIFILTQGNIHFAGSADKKTTLYIVASREIDDRIRADIIVKGPVTKPVINFRSSPPLSQREVLSYILFNRGISDITADQGDQLSQSFISLNSSDQPATSDDLLTRLRKNVGIDRLDFTTNDKENKDIGLQVGKNITENISVSVNQSVMSVTPVIAVEVKLRKNIKAQAEAGVNQDAPVKMSIKWKKDY